MKSPAGLRAEALPTTTAVLGGLLQCLTSVFAQGVCAFQVAGLLRPGFGELLQLSSESGW